MKSSTNDQAEGKFHKVKLNIRDVAGKASLNAESKGVGKNEMQAGSIQERSDKSTNTRGNRADCDVYTWQ